MFRKDYRITLYNFSSGPFVPPEMKEIWFTPYSNSGPVFFSSEADKMNCELFRCVHLAGFQRMSSQQFQRSGAGNGNRTRIFSLEGCCSTFELYPLEQGTAERKSPVLEYLDIPVP